jgi:hypothetical protein
MPVCIYCKKTKGPTDFANEHVFSRALCGQGNNWSLPELVCKKCNGIFSKSESHWARCAVESMMRNFSGPLGRSEQEGRRRQPIEVTELYLMLRGDPLAYDAGFAYPNLHFIRPQIAEWPPAYAANSSDQAAADEMYRQLQVMVDSNEMFVTEPMPDGSAHDFNVTRFVRTESGFQAVDAAMEDDAVGIWLRSQPPDHSLQSKMIGETHQVTRRIVLDDRDRLYARAASPADLADFMNIVMRTTPNPFAPRPGGKGNEELLIRISIKLVHVYRCVLKTGLNLLCHARGFGVAMAPEFNLVCRELIGGVPADSGILGRCWILGAGPAGVVDEEDFKQSGNFDIHEMVLDVNEGKARFRLRLFGSMAYVGYLGDVSPELAKRIGTIKAEVDFMGNGIRLI